MDSSCRLHIAPRTAQLRCPHGASVPCIMSQLTYKNVVGPKIRSLRIQFSWTQDALAKYLRRMGWDISRSTLAKIEARLIHVSDSDLLYFVRLFEVRPDYLLPELDRDEHLGTAVRRLLDREQAA
jgi:transcriptional regulator with XRE-family HTH domain